MQNEVIETRSLSSKPVLPEEKSWREHYLKTEQETPQRLEDAAKFIGSAQALSLSLFLGLFERQEAASTVAQGWLLASLTAWLLSVVASLMVVFPFHWHLDPESSVDIQRVHRKIKGWKYGLLIISTLLFVGALGAAGVVALIPFVLQ